MKNDVIKMKKKILPFLIVGFLVLSSVGAVAISDEKNEKLEPLQEQYVVFGVHGGFGIKISMRTLFEVYDEPGEIEITIDATIMIIGQKSNIPIPIPLHPDDNTIYVKTGLKLGFGRCTVKATGDFDNDGIPDTENAADGIILGPFVIFKAFALYPPD